VSAGAAEESRAEAALRGLELFGGARFHLRRAALPVLVPMHRAVENECWIAATESGAACFLKILCADMRSFVDGEATLEASLKAAALELAPAVRGHDLKAGALAFDYLGADWRTADMETLQEPATRAAVIAAKRRLHQSVLFARTRTIFDLLRDYREMQDRIAAPLPEDDRDLRENVDRIESAFAAAGFDLRPCHGDGIASNIMLGRDNAVRLVDFEFASNDDPHHDLAALLVDIEPWDDGIRAAIEMYGGRFDERVYNRVKLHMILDDVSWAGFALMAAHLSPRRHVEFFKYGAFKLLRCRYHLRTWPVEEMLRKI
jgi:thiamine kinase-like enzyme